MSRTSFSSPSVSTVTSFERASRLVAERRSDDASTSNAKTAAIQRSEYKARGDRPLG
jgi:hypothetical protein